MCILKEAIIIYIHVIDYAHSSNIKSMSPSVKSMVFIQYGKITINLFAQVKQFVSASVDSGKQLYYVVIMFHTSV